MKLCCEIVEDLLPLVADDLCSQQTKRAVEEHLQGCQRCRTLYNNAHNDPIPTIEPEKSSADKAIQKGFKKIRVRWWASILIILALIPVAFLSWNQYSARGVGYTNIRELVTGNAFMDCLTEGNYEKAYGYIDVEELKQVWLEEWFEEETLANMEADGLAKFCEMGSRLEDLDGIKSYEYVGISFSGRESDGTAVYEIIYKVEFAGKIELFRLNVSDDGVETLNSGGSFLEDPLAQFSIWSEYLWQDYEGCYFDPETKKYIYYDQE